MDRYLPDRSPTGHAAAVLVVEDADGKLRTADDGRRVTGRTYTSREKAEAAARRLWRCEQ